MSEPSPKPFWEQQIFNAVTECIEAMNRLRADKPAYRNARDVLRLLERTADNISFHNRINPDRVTAWLEIDFPKLSSLIEEVTGIIEEKEETDGP